MPQSEGGYKLFKIGELFDIHPTKAYKLTNAELFVEGGKNPVVSNSSVENGIGGFSNLPTTEEGNMITFSDTTTSDAIFYQPYPFVGYPHVQGLYPIKYKDKWNEKTLLYVMSIFRKCAQGRFDYATKFTRVIALEMPLLLPVDHAGEIDFHSMEIYIQELERGRMLQLEEYLGVAELSNVTLTISEVDAINRFENNTILYKKVLIGDIFEKIQTNTLKYKVKALPTKPENDYIIPALTAGIINQGLSCFVPRQNATILKNVISVSANGANTGAMFFQPHEFTVLQDSYAIKCKTRDIESSEGLFYVTALEKVIRKYYDWSNKAGWNKIKDSYITLPISADGSIDYAFMENYINAIKKQTITRVKEYIDSEYKTEEQLLEEIHPTITPLHIHDTYLPGRIPLYTLRAACGYFDDGQLPEEEGWIDATGQGFTPDKDRYFAVHAKGDSMLPKIHDGDICVFEWYHAGSRNGEIVLTQSSEYDDAYGGRYTIKRYHSEKIVTDEGWQHAKVELQPLNPDFEPIELDEFGDYRTIGIFKGVLE